MQRDINIIFTNVLKYYINILLKKNFNVFVLLFNFCQFKSNILYIYLV